MNSSKKLLIFSVLLVLLTTITKLAFAPKLEWSGFSPILAIALFSGMMVKEKGKSFLYPLAALLVSDIIIQILFLTKNFDYPGFYKFQWLNYSVLLLSVVIGWMLKGKKITNIFISVLAAPTLFFLVSNFLVWAGHGGYSHPITFSGLLLCYTDGLPFYKNSLLATIIFLPAIMLMYNLLMKKNYGITLKAV
jgi:hypothetical protein